MSNILIHPTVRSSSKQIEQLEKSTGLHAHFRHGKTGAILSKKQPVIHTNNTPPTAA